MRRYSFRSHGIKLSITGLIIAFCFLHGTPSTQAQSMSNDNYIIRLQEFNSASSITSEENYQLRPTAGSLNTSTSEGVNFKIKTGIENLLATLPFSISLSSNIIDFGTLSPTNPVIRTLDLAINSLSAYGYSIIVFEDKSLTADDGSEAFIPNTSCDNGMCDTETASEWTNTLTYGFGYRCDNISGVNCNSSFTQSKFYKPFPDTTNDQAPQSVMSGIGANDRKVRLSYKVNIAGNQAEKNYNNIITFIGVPNF